MPFDVLPAFCDSIQTHYLSKFGSPRLPTPSGEGRAPVWLIPTVIKDPEGAPLLLPSVIPNLLYVSAKTWNLEFGSRNHFASIQQSLQQFEEKTLQQGEQLLIKRYFEIDKQEMRAAKNLGMEQTGERGSAAPASEEDRQAVAKELAAEKPTPLDSLLPDPSEVEEAALLLDSHINVHSPLVSVEGVCGMLTREERKDYGRLRRYADPQGRLASIG